MKLLIGTILAVATSLIFNVAYYKYPNYMIAYIGGAATVWVCMVWYDFYDRHFKN